MVKIGKEPANTVAFGASKAIAKSLGGLNAPRKDPLPSGGGGDTTEPEEPAHKPVPPPKVRGGSGTKKKKSSTKSADVIGVVKAAPVKRLKVNAEEKVEWEQAALRLSAAVGTAVGFSKMTRALWDVYLRHEQDVLRNAADEASWTQPSTSNAMDQAALDAKIADLVNEGLMVAARRPKNRRRDEE